MFFVSAQKRAQRLDICRKCKHFRTTTKSCGTLGFGTKITDGKNTMKLCGCVMTIKARLKTSDCPLGKWSAELSRSEVKDIRDFLGTITGNKISGSQNKKLTDIWNKASGTNRKVSSCKSCVRDMIKQLKNLTND